MSIAKFSVRNSVLINMIMIIVFVLGISSMITIPKEESPPVDFGMAYIWVTYAGVSSSEMESLIVDKIEDEISDVDGIDFISSTAQEGVATIMVRFLPNVNTDDAWENLNREFNKIKDLPDDADDPQLFQIKMREVNPICDLCLIGEYSPLTMKKVAEELEDGLLNIDDVSKLEMWGDKERAIYVDADKYKLNNYGLTLNDLITAISNKNLNLPGGKIKFSNAEFIVRTMGEFKESKEIADVIVRSDKDGRIIKVQDMAEVKDTYNEDNDLIIAKLNGKPNISFQVYKKGTGNVIKVIQDIKDYINKFEKEHKNIKIEMRNDDSIEIGSNIRTLGFNALLGTILVFFTLWFFIGWKNALFAAWGIPFSFLFAIAMMKFLGLSINNLSLFALILVLGMIVDDAIVVIENVHRHMEMKKSSEEAAIVGTSEIMWPIISAVTTTVAAFMPMLMMEGTMGKFMQVFPIVVSIALLASLFECLVILPSHLADFNKKSHEKDLSHGKFYSSLLRFYENILIKFLKKRVLVVLSIVALLILSAVALIFGLVRMDFFPSGEISTLVLQVKAPMGTDIEKSNEISSSIENYIKNQMKEKEDVNAVVTYVGFIEENHRADVKTNNISFYIDFVESKKMKYGSEAIKKSLRSYLATIPEIVYVNFDKENSGPPTGADVEIRIKGDNLGRLEAISEYVQGELAKIKGLKDIRDDFEYGKKEVRIIPNERKLAMYGLTTREVSSYIRIACNGAIAGKLSGDGSDEYNIIVRLDKKYMDNYEDLKNYYIRNSAGKLISLKEIADFKITQGIATIRHRDKKRVITINANSGTYSENGKEVKKSTGEINDILQGNKLKNITGIFQNFSQKFPGYTIEYGGMAEEQAKSFGSLFKAFGVAVLCIFTILAAQFKSYVQPFIVMTALPFAFMGVVIGLLVSNLPFSLPTMIAVVALAGVVVNDSLVLVDFVNKLRDEGHDRWNSLINAGKVRLRPIILTTTTTIAGFMPMIFSTSEASRDWKPIAVSMAFGLGFATLLTLLVIPCIYSLVDSLFGKLKLTRFKSHMSLDDALILREKGEE